MKRHNGEHITEKALRNRYTLLRNRVLRKQQTLNDNREFMDIRKVERREKSIARDIRELQALTGWLGIAQKHGYMLWKDSKG